jgi:hypothetical protein
MKNTQGFIALTSVLIMSAIFLSITLGVASNAIAQLDISSAFITHDTALYNSEACVAHALLELQRTLGYEGDEVILIGDGSCTIELIEDSDTDERVIRTHSTVGLHNYATLVTVSYTGSDLYISAYRRSMDE